MVENGYEQLDQDEPNKVGDLVVYYNDEDEDESWDLGEPIEHSAIVSKVDEEGNTVEVISKMGLEDGISTNHPNASGFYDKYVDQDTEEVYPTSHTYFRQDEEGKKTN